MNISKEQYKIVFTNDSINEMDSIYQYISQKLFASNSSKRLMNKVDKTIQTLKYMPRAYSVVKIHPELELEYRRIVINKYIIIYTIAEEEKKVYITHMYYSGSNYLSKL